MGGNPSTWPAPVALRGVCMPSLRTALVVGLILNGINNGSALATGDRVDWGAVVLDFVVPFCVAAYSRLAQSRRSH
ncbi:MAG: hypothetical protein D6720_12580 [Gammaproteobacteria bacterium]|nr:MAG: hypothetical protein D6720_12580 [Gammaproteobacteria bacterium]